MNENIANVLFTTVSSKTLDMGLENNELSAIIEIFKNNPLILGAAVFGSRAKGGHSPYSDVDIAVYGNLNISDVEDIICDLDELPFVYKFDVVAYGLIKNIALRRHIDKVGVMVYSRLTC